MFSSVVRPARVALRRRVLGDHHSLLRGFASVDKWGVTNDRITARVVNIVEDGGNMLMDVPIRQAIQHAQSQGVDLVQVSPVGKLPAVCRLFDAKKRLYEMKKANKKAAQVQKPKPDKEVIVGAKIAVSIFTIIFNYYIEVLGNRNYYFLLQPNDLNMKVEQLKRFLNKGHKVKVTVKFAQAYHLKDQCLGKLQHIGELVDAETGVPAGQPKEQFGAVFMFYSPAN
ncbi:Translation initiation factor IF-3 [Phytophthora citrophthora]|uniref:Translation initiation factor IF-3 n=1 Tax=Phytophthora citrophthora TaxID=4793 RepID=A0AAD9GG41_9STRA|nr:Translation initiation factor IF-3 [Phytophthora citrophthora]